MSVAICLACHAPVSNATGKWRDDDGNADCPERSGGHRVEQIIPDPPKDWP